MSKIFYLFIMLLFSYELIANEAEWILESTPHRSTKSINSISLNKGEITVDGRKLTDVEVQVKFTLLNPLFRKPVGDKYNCHKGKYILSSQIKAKKVVEKGCLESPRYLSILNSFEGMKKEEVLK